MLGEDWGLAAHHWIALRAAAHWRNAFPDLLQVKAAVVLNKSHFKPWICPCSGVYCTGLTQYWLLRLCSLCFAVNRKEPLKMLQDHQSIEMIKSSSLLGFYAIIMKNLEAEFPNILFVNLEFPRMQILLWLRRRLAQQLFSVRWGIKREKLLLCPCLFSNSPNKYLLLFETEIQEGKHPGSALGWERNAFSARGECCLSLCSGMCI